MRFDDCGEPQLGEKLSALGYTHVVVRRNSPAGRWIAGGPPPAGLAPGPEFEDSRVLAVRAERPRAYVKGLLGFYPREYRGPAAWRWMGQAGALTLANATGEPVALALELELASFPGGRRVEWLLDGRRLGELAVVADWRRYVVALGSIAPGDSTLSLACQGPAVAPNDIRRNGDLRALCLAVGSWRVKESGR